MSKPTKPDRRPAKKATTKPHASIASKLSESQGGGNVTKPLHDVGTRPPRTVTVPEHVRGAWAQGSESVTALAIDGDDRIYDLPRSQAEVTVGSQPDRDVVIASAIVSRTHCVIQRRGLRTFVIDKGSKNGISVDGNPVSEFEAPPGKRFEFGGKLLAVTLNDAMRQHLPIIGQLVCRESERAEVGGDNRPSRLRVLSYALDVAPILITGEAGCDHDRLARALHAMSKRRGHDLITLQSVPTDRKTQREVIVSGSRSSLVLPIGDAEPRLDPTFVSMLFDRSYDVRVIVLASAEEHAISALGPEIVARANKIHLRPIAFRPSVIGWLIDEVLRERGSTLRTGELTPENRSALQNYDWRGNWIELRKVADWLIAIERYGSLRAAAEPLGVSQSSFNRWIHDLGLTMPLTRNGPRPDRP